MPSTVPALASAVALPPRSAAGDRRTASTDTGIEINGVGRRSGINPSAGKLHRNPDLGFGGTWPVTIHFTGSRSPSQEGTTRRTTITRPRWPLEPKRGTLNSHEGLGNVHQHGRGGYNGMQRSLWSRRLRNHRRGTGADQRTGLGNHHAGESLSVMCLPTSQILTDRTVANTRLTDTATAAYTVGLNNTATIDHRVARQHTWPRLQMLLSRRLQRTGDIATISYPMPPASRWPQPT